MKIRLPNRKANASGMAVIALIALLAIILFFISANLRTVHLVRSELRLIERQQTNRWASVSTVMNSSSLTNVVARDPGGSGSSPLGPVGSLAKNH